MTYLMRVRFLHALKYKCTFMNILNNFKTRKYLWNTKRPQPPPDSKGYWLSRICPCFGNSKLLGNFGQSGGRICQMAHLYAKTFHMSLFPGLYDHPLQRNSLEKLMFRKTDILDILAKFGHLRWPNMAKTVKRHIYRPRPFICAYSQVSTTIRYKETAFRRGINII